MGAFNMTKYLAVAAIVAAFAYASPAHAQNSFQCTAISTANAKTYKGAFRANAQLARQSALGQCQRFSRPGQCKILNCIG